MSIPCKMRPVGLESLPLGYTRVEYLESTGTQYILAPWAAYDEIEYTSQLRNTTYDIHCPAGCSDSEGTGIYLTEYNSSGLYCRYGVNYYYSRPNANFPSYEVHEVKIKDFKLYLNNNLFANIQRSDFEFGNSDYIGVFVRFTKSKNAVDYVYQGAIYRVSIKSKDVNVYNFIPCLDDKGIPCMLDTVTRQAFRNQGTGQFIIGLTMAQALNLANLPAIGGSLTVSLPLEAAFNAKVQSALDIAADKGWVITVQYHESEVATSNLDADFLESNGAQVIDTDIYPGDKDDGFDIKFVTLDEGSHYRPLLSFACAATNIKERRNFAISSNKFTLASQVWTVFPKSVITGETYRANGSCQYIKNIDTLAVNDELLDNSDSSGVQYPYANCGITYALFGQKTLYDDGVRFTSFGKWQVLYCKMYIEGQLVRDFIPCLDPIGIPCMYDAVSSQNFYNADTSEGATPFIVGFETTEKAAVSLSKLPVTTDGTLTVSLPASAQNESTLVPKAIDIATNRGWTIITQYREN